MNSRKSIDLTHPIFTSYPQAKALQELERLADNMSTIITTGKLNSSRLTGAVERIHSTVERMAIELHEHASKQANKE